MTTSWGAAPGDGDGEADTARLSEADTARLSFKCWLLRDRPHTPCAGTTDDALGKRCRCRCHARRALPPGCSVRRCLAAVMAAIAAWIIYAALGGPVSPTAFYVAALAAFILAAIAFSQDHAWHIEQARMLAYRNRLNQAHAQLILAAEEIGVKIDIPE